MAASCNSRKGCGWLPFCIAKEEAWGGGSPLLELTALLRAAIVPMPFDFSRTFRYFSRAFSVPSFLCSPPSPAMLLHLACRKGFFRVVPLPLRDAYGAQGMHAEADPDMMRAGGDRPASTASDGVPSFGPPPCAARRAYSFSWRETGFAGYLTRVMAARRRAMRRIRPFKEGKA